MLAKFRGKLILARVFQTLLPISGETFLQYMRPSFYRNMDRQILTNFVKICQILVCRILRRDSLNEAHERLITVIKLIERKYGSNKITPNLHLSLHLNECAYDYGPLYVFWCFSFERMNGILGKFFLIILILLLK